MNVLVVVFDFISAKKAKQLRFLIQRECWGEHEPFGVDTRVYFLRTKKSQEEFLKLIKEEIKPVQHGDFLVVGEISRRLSEPFGSEHKANLDFLFPKT